MKEHLYQLQTSGYTFLRGAISTAPLDALRAGVDKLLQEDDATWGAERLEAMGQRGALRNLCDAGAPFVELLVNSPVYPIVDQMLENGYILHSYDGLVLLPGYGRFPWDFHTDFSPLAGVGFPGNRTFGINCLYYLDDATEENGATWLVPASHRCVLPAPAAEDLAQLACQTIGRAGDVLLFDARIWHCAGENRSQQARRLIKVLYCSSWLRPQMDYARAVSAGVRSRLDARTLNLLGVGVAPPATVEELRERLSQRARP